jgi:hypothetical protein
MNNEQGTPNVEGRDLSAERQATSAFCGSLLDIPELFYATIAARFAPGKPLFSSLNCHIRRRYNHGYRWKTNS